MKKTRPAQSGPPDSNNAPAGRAPTGTGARVNHEMVGGPNAIANQARVTDGRARPTATGFGGRRLPCGLTTGRRTDAWLRRPVTALRRWFGHDAARLAEFQSRYRKEAGRPTTPSRRRNGCGHWPRLDRSPALRRTRPAVQSRPHPQDVSGKPRCALTLCKVLHSGAHHPLT